METSRVLSNSRCSVRNPDPVFLDVLGTGEPVGAGVRPARNRTTRRPIASSLTQGLRVNPTPVLMKWPTSEKRIRARSERPCCAGCREPWKYRKRQDLFRCLFALGQHSLHVSERLEALLQVQRHRIVDGRPHAVFGQVPGQGVPFFNPDHELVEYVPCARNFHGKPDQTLVSQVGKSLDILVRVQSALFVPSIERGQFNSKERCLNRVQLEVASYERMVVSLGFTVVAKEADLFGQILTPGHQSASIAHSAEVFRGEKRETPRIAGASNPLPMIFGPDGLRCVLDHLYRPRSQISLIRFISAACPKRCTGMTAFVRSVIRACICSGSILKVFGSMSANTGRAPRRYTDPAVEKKVKLGTMTSSPGPTSKAIMATMSASVPDESPTAYGAPDRQPALLRVHRFPARL